MLFKFGFFILVLLSTALADSRPHRLKGYVYTIDYDDSDIEIVKTFTGETTLKYAIPDDPEQVIDLVDTPVETMDDVEEGLRNFMAPLMDYVDENAGNLGERDRREKKMMSFALTYDGKILGWDFMSNADKLKEKVIRKIRAHQ